jgi:ectoine hydroxylase-related dioxygenase (phytanoyl-CoA dioxygenase family)
MSKAAVIEALVQRGFTTVAQLLRPAEVDRLLAAMAAIDTDGVGTRGLSAKVPAVRTLATSSTIRALIETVLGDGALPVRSIFFNKSVAVNWQVAWHQDTTIAVADRHEIAGFTAWSVKEGVPHVQAPAAVLERMVTLRLHLDAADATNGALWVAPGSHRFGHIRQDEAAIVERCGTHLCTAGQGDALLMRPLLLHASRKVTSECLRRVLHLEFAASDALPPPLCWAE